ncbi:hypothetical protein AB6805_22960 [Chitinophaga sp. RCC_12]|uniref:hypothetical protein n=1 Tax=Chitinophaga sp. RCC_12 TaxID=3239226 RepID=UPI00352695D8
MKSICRLLIYILAITLFTTACNKKELAIPPTAVVKMTFQGYSFDDTLEVVKNNEVLATLRANSSFSVIALIAVKNDKEEVGLRKKGTTAILSTFEVNRVPFEQQKKIFFDGKTVNDKMELTPVSNPANVGFRLLFKTDFPYFYGGPVDFVIWEQTVDNNTYEYTNKKITEVKNVGNAFGDFVELPRLISTDQVSKNYIFRVYKAGTTELPYKEGVDLSAIPDFEFYYGIIDAAKAGQSALLMVGPYYYSDTMLGEGFRVEDIAYFFR